MKRRPIALWQSLICLLLCVSMLVGTTFAWFTDQVVSGKNTIAAGNLDVELYHSNPAVQNEQVKTDTLLFKDLQGNPILWEPGVVSYENLRVTNAGDLALQYQLAMETANENFVVYPDGTMYGLSQILKVGVVEGGITATDRAGVVASVDTANWTTLASFLRSGTLLPAGKGESEKTWGVVIYWQPGDNDNLWNLNNGKQLDSGDVLSIELGVKLEATQYTSEMDSFGDQYDAGAIFPGLSLPITGSAPVAPTAENKVPAGGVQITAGNITVTVPEGTQLLPNTTVLPVSITDMPETQSNVILGATEVMKSLDVHVDGIAEDNTVPLQVTIPEALAPSLNIGNYRFYHVEDGVTNEMVSVSSLAELNAHNQFFYDVATGDVTLCMATFSEVVAVTDYLNPWKGGVDFSWYDDKSSPYSIANGDQLWAFSQIVGGMNGRTQDSFSGKTVKLTSDINLGDAAANDDTTKIFYPIGYTNDTNKYEKTNTSGVTSTLNSFEGTFDGQGHTIADFYQNTWDMFGDYNDGYAANSNHYKDGMGLFGYVYGGTVKNLTVENFSSDGEFTPTGVIAAFAAANGSKEAKFENIALVNCNPRDYNTGNGGIIGIAGNYDDQNTQITLKNITVDNSNKITALWGSWDVACGGLVGMFRGNAEGGTGKIHFENCHVGAQIDVYNDVCANYQYYAYRYSGMLIGSVRHNETIDGHVYPSMAGITASGTTVHFGDWNDYYYCELVANSLASYTHDHQMSRLEQVQAVDTVNMKVTTLTGETKDIPSGRVNYVVVKAKDDKNMWIHGDGKEFAECYHFVNGTQHFHDVADSDNPNINETVNNETVLKEDKQLVYREFENLITGYGWGVTSKGVNDLDGVTILDRNSANSVKKFVADAAFEYIITPSSDSDSIGRVYVSELFDAAKAQDNLGTLDPYKINFSTLMVSVTDITDTGITAEYKPYTGAGTGWGTLWFKPRPGTQMSQNPGMVKITIQDYQYCEPTSIYATVVWGTFDNFMKAGNAVNATSVKMTTDGVFDNGGEVTFNCPHCKKTVTWHDLNATVTGGNYVANAYDHYYLSDNLTMQDQEVVFEDSYDAKKFCLHLNGKTLMNTGDDKAAIQVAPGATLSIMGNGIVGGPGLKEGTYGSKYGYPGAAVDNRSILNLYGGTYVSSTLNRPVISMFDVTGPDSAYAINMFEGTVIDGIVDGGANPADAILEDDENDTGIEDDTVEAPTENKRSTAVVVVHGKNHNFNMYGGVIKNGNNKNSGGNVYVYRSTFNMRGGSIENGYANRGGNVFVGYGGDGRFYLRGGKIQYGQAWNLGGNVFCANAFIMNGGEILGGQVLMPYSENDETGKTSGGSGGSLAVVSGQIHIKGGIVDGTLPDDYTQKYNALFGGLAHVARGELHIAGNAVLRNGTVDSRIGSTDAINVQVIIDESTNHAKLYLEGGTVEGTIRVQKSTHEKYKTSIIVNGAKGIMVGKKNADGTINGGIRLGDGVSLQVKAYASSSSGNTLIYVRKDTGKNDNLVAVRHADASSSGGLTSFHEQRTLSAEPSKYIVALVEGQLVFADPTPVTPDPSEPSTETTEALEPA